jgi:hypothetical protein
VAEESKRQPFVLERTLGVVLDTHQVRSGHSFCCATALVTEYQIALLKFPEEQLFMIGHDRMPRDLKVLETAYPDAI